MEYGGDHGCQYEKQHKEREGPLQAECGAGRALFLPAAPDGKDEGDRDDRQRPCHFYDCGCFQRVAPVDPVPCRCCCSDGRGVVDGCAGEQAESFVAQSQSSAERREDQCGRHVEQEDDGDGLRHFLIRCVDDRRSCCDGAPAADRGTYAYKDGVVGTEFQRFIQDKCDDQRSGDGGDNDGKRLLSLSQDLCQIHAETEEDDSSLQDLFGCVVDPGCKRLLLREDQSDDHPGQDREYRAADDRNQLAGEPGGNSDDQAEQKPCAVFLKEIHSVYPPCVYIWE